MGGAMSSSIIMSLCGGALVGLASSLMLVFNGRVTGISGIIYGLFEARREEFVWRMLFLFGLVAGGLTLFFVYPDAFPQGASMSSLRVGIAGILVGFGTILGSGCTSGHGVCGVSRISKRSIVATSIFILSGVATVFIAQHMGSL